MLEPLIAGLFAIPLVVFLPLFILFFGIGVESKIAFGATYAFFPIVLNTIGGISQVDPRFVTVARSMGATERQMFRRVLLPAALPVIVTGLRIGCIIGFLSILGSEMIAGLRGLGSRIVWLAEGMNTAEMFAYIVFVIIMAAILNMSLTRLQKRFSEAGGAAMTEAGATLRAPSLPQARPFERLRRYFLQHPGAARLAIVIALFALWEIAGHTVLDPNFLSSPSAIIRAAPRVLAETGIQWALWASFYELAIAFVMSVVVGVAIGLPIGLHRFSLRSVLPLVLLLYSIPQVTILPLFVLYFGIGAGSKIAFGFSHGVFPIILNVIAGVQSVEDAHLTAARSMGATRLQTIRRVILPAMTPSLFVGLRLAMSATLLGVLLAELYVSTGGIGHYTRLFTDSFDPPATFTLVAALAVMALILNESVRRAERRASFWRAHQR